MKTIKDVVKRLSELEVTVYLDGGKLKTRSLPGRINDEVKNLIRENKQGIIDFLEMLEDNKQPVDSISPRNSEEQFLPLSYSQQRLWLIDRMNGSSAEYNMPIKLRVRGQIELDRIEQSLREVIQRHESLRTIYIEKNGEPKQSLNENYQFDLLIHDFSEQSETERTGNIEQAIHQNSHATFDLNSDLMIRGCFVVMKRIDDVVVDGLLLLCIHHIAGDGWSMGILIDDFTSFYQQSSLASCKVEPLEIQYADYAIWQRDWMSSNLYHKQEKYWLDHLKGVPAVHNINLDKPRPPIKRYEGGQVEATLEKSTADTLTRIAQRYRVSEFALLHAVLSLVFSKHSGTDDIVIGTALANRTRHELNRLVGFFVNTVALRVNTNYQNFAEYLEHVGQVNLDAQTNQEVPFETIVEKLRLSRTPKYTPLVQLFFTMSTGLENEISIDGLEFENYAGGDVVSKFDISVSASISDSGLSISWVYDKSIFEESTVINFSQHFINCLQSVAQEPQQLMSQIKILSDEEEDLLCRQFNQTEYSFNKELLIHELFEQQVNKQNSEEFVAANGVDNKPNSSAAIVFKNEIISYQLLNQKANQLARYLKSQGVEEDTLVGILLERSADTVVSILAVLKAGGAYLPLDTDYPEARLNYILDDSQLDFVISRNKYSSILNNSTNKRFIKTVDLDNAQLMQEISALNSDNLPISEPRNNNRLAYVIYTSGSTGNPKGVMVEHRSLVNQNIFEIDEFELSRNSRVIHLFSFSFDPGAGHLFSGLNSGATVYIEDPRNNLIRQIYDNKITHAAFPTSVLMIQPHENLESLKVISVGGEKCTPETIEFWSQGRKFINLYGPTEATIYCTRSVYQGDDISRCIGTPINNSRCYVLDSQCNLVPVGAPGELYIGGACVARGYLNRDKLTAESFIANPFSQEPEDRLYRTGDMVRYRADKKLEFIGRADEQVKFRGFRIELGEIEVSLVSHQLVDSAVVVLKEFSGSEMQLVAYILPSETISDETTLLEELKLFLHQQLPQYMHPSTYLILDEIPLTAGGKVDRQALPEPVNNWQDKKIEPQTQEEHQLVAIWSKLLKKPEESISIDANFFELGGHSLLLVRMIADIRDIFSIELNFIRLFESPNIISIAKLISEGEQKANIEKIKSVPRDRTFFPMSFSQQRLWFIDQLNQGSPEYNMPLAIEVSGYFDCDAAEQAINKIIQRHESLRTRFVQDDDGPCQTFREDFEFKLEYYDLQALSSSARETRAREIIQQDSQYTFNLSNDLLIKASYIHLMAEDQQSRGILTLNMHHIIADGWSMGVLVKEFVAYYQSIIAGDVLTIRPLPIQYADYTLWQQESLANGVMKQQLSYWKKQLEDVPAVHNLPLDFQRPEVKQNEGGIVQLCVEEVLTEKLVDYANKSGITLFMLLHSALGLVLSRHSNSKDIVIGTPVANRTQAELEPLIGFFLNTLVLRVSTEHNSLESYLEHVKKVNVEAQANQGVPFEYLVEHCQVPRTTQHSPIFQILLTMDSTEKVDLSLDGLEFTSIENELVNAKFDLTLSAQLNNGKIYLSWVYDRSIFLADNVSKLSRHFKRVLTEIISGKQTIQDIEILEKDEIDYLVSELNRTQSDYPQDKLIHHLFESQVEKTPNDIALVDFKKKLTYQEFNHSANQLAHHLIELGLKPGEFVGLYVERSIDMMIGLMAIIKAGGAYVPLDPAHGTQRLEYSIKDTGMEILVTQLASNSEKINFDTLKHVVCLDCCELKKRVAEKNNDNPVVNFRESKKLDGEDANLMTSESLVYLIYTSGSTGQPKGVEITHRGLVDYCFWGINQYYPTNLSGARIISSVSFDGTVTSLYFPLLVGGYVELVQADTGLDTFWDELLESQQPCMIKITPSHIQGLGLNDNNQVSQCKHTFVIGGELLTRKTLSHLRSYFPNAFYYHHYGPTEAVVGCTLLDLNDYQSKENSTIENLNEQQGFPIGKPMGNVQVYITDSDLNLLPFGTPGELCIGGDGLARGYLNHPQLTNEKFIPNPFSTNQTGRIYRTGDLVNYTADGNINFIGRLDGQVKVRGFRIELGEIEQKLLQQKQIKNAVVIAHNESSNQTRLVAYLISKNEAIDEKEFINQVKLELKEQLPDYMIPALFICTSELKLTSSGKVDRKSLPAPDFSMIGEDYVLPQTDTERALLKIWSELLNIPVDKISVLANFFELGGDSILSIQVASRAAKLGYHFTTKDIFAKQTVRDLAALVSRKKLSEVDQKPVTGKSLLLPIQKRFLTGKIALHHYNQAVMLKTPEDFSFICLKNIVRAIYQRHDALRLTFCQKDNEWEATYQPYSESMLAESLLEFRLTESDFSQLPSIADSIQESFNLNTGPLLKVGYFVNKQGEGRLLLVLHHLIVDGVSWRVLLEDLSQLYTQIRDKSVQKDEEFLTLSLPPKTNSYQDWGEFLSVYSGTESLARERDYWVQMLQEKAKFNVNKTESEFLQEKSTEEYSGCRFSINEALTKQLLHQANKTYRTQINEILLAALLLGFKRNNATSAIRIDLESHGREPLTTTIDLSQTIGWFTSVYPLYLSAETSDIGQLICIVKEQCRSVPYNGIGYGILKYQAKDEQIIALSKANGAKILFNYLGQFDQVANDDAAFSPAFESTGKTISPEHKFKHHLNFSGMISAGELSFNLNYRSDLYTKAEMNRLMKQFEDGLVQIITHCENNEGLLTPADFPLLQDPSSSFYSQQLVSQKQLNKWQAKYDITDIYPATGMQQGLLFHSELEAGAYVSQMQLAFEKEINLTYFQNAWQQLVNRHDIFRTAFVTADSGRLLQLVQKEAMLDWRQIDLTHLESKIQQDEINRLRIKDKTNGFNVSIAPLMRVTVFILAQDRYQMLWSHHHALTDGWCLPLIFNEVMQHYQSQLNQMSVILAEPKAYRNYVAWLHQQDSCKAEKFWRGQLETITTPTPLPGDWNSNRTSQNKSYDILLNEEDTAALVNTTKACRTTVNIALQAAWSYLLARYSSEKTIIFGATVSGRPSSLNGVEEMIGLFINSVPVVANVSDELSIEMLLAQLHASQVEREDFSHVPLSKIQQFSSMPNHISLFESLIIFENYPVNEAVSDKVENTGLEVSSVDSFEGTNYPLSIAAALTDTLSINVEYHSGRFDSQFIGQLGVQLKQLLQTIASSPKTLLSELQLLTKDDQRMLFDALVAKGQNLSSSPNKSQPIFQLFEQQSKRTPEKIAITCGGMELTYRELSERSDRLAEALQSLGVSCGSRIGLSVGRSVNILVSMLAVMKSGAAYVPLDPDAPLKRLEHIIADADVNIIITESKEKSILSTQENITLIQLDKNSRVVMPPESATKEKHEGICSASLAYDVAYIIYTSGTSGLPKGVEVTHDVLSSHITQVKEHLNFKQKDVFLQLASYNFDAFLEQTFSALIGGSQLIISDSSLVEPIKFFQLINQHQVTVTDLSPAFFNELLQAEWLTSWQNLNLHTVVVGGESVNRSTLKQWFELEIAQKCQLYNAYGPTETVITATIQKLTKSDIDQVGIGLPLGSRTAYILDNQYRLVPPGAIGELFIGGELLAKGYLNQSELNSERFINDCFDSRSEARLYRTGDLVRYIDNKLVFVGRADEQVKIRGFRIELGELEYHLMSFAKISAAVVVECKEENGSSFLTAYILPEKEIREQAEQLTFLEEIKQEMSTLVPGYMVPSLFMMIEKLPLTVNGKVNKAALPKPVREESTVILPQTATEEKLQEIWSDILNINPEKLGVTVSFFDLGGHSLSAMRLKSEISKKMHFDISLKHIFQYANIRSQANHIEKNAREEKHSQIVPVDRKPSGMPLSYSQQRLWFIHQLDDGGSKYNMPNALKVNGDFDIDIAEQAIRKIIHRHEILRTAFIERDGEAVQVINQVTDFKLVRDDLSHLSPDHQEIELQKIIDENQAYAFDLASGCLVRAVYVNLTEVDVNQKSQQSGALIFNLHHIVSDGWSMGILVDEFVHYYDAIESGLTETLEKLPIQYADYASWQRQYLNEEILSQQLDYWQTYLDDAPSCHHLPLDRPRSQKVRQSGLITQSLSGDLIQQISLRLKQNDCTLFMLLQASLAVHIGRMTHQNDVVIGSPNAGRGNKELEGLIGLFLNTQVFRTQFSDETTLASLLAQTRESFITSLAFNETPFEAIVDRVKPPRAEHTPVFQILINFNNVGVTDTHLEDVRFSPIVNKTPENKFDITLYVNEQESGRNKEIILSWVYNAGIFDGDTIQNLAEEFEFLLAQMVANPDKKVIQHHWKKQKDWRSAEKPEYLLPGDNVIALFEHWANASPEALALSFEDESYSYAQLNKEVNQLANALVEKLRIGPNSRVAIALKRTHLRVKAILATLKIGACYIPLSEELPTERLRFMVEDSESEVILTDKKTASEHVWFDDFSVDEFESASTEHLSLRSVKLDDETFEQLTDIQSDENLPGENLSSDSIAHIIYTSGSTGQPKGVMGTHAATFNRVAWMLKEFPFETNESQAHITSMAFIRGVWELFVPLCGGARLVLVDRQNVRQVDRLWEILNTEKITRLVTAPTLMQAITEVADNEQPQASNHDLLAAKKIELRHWFVSGEPLLQTHAHKVLNMFDGVNVYNLYGSTEVMSDVLWHQVDKNDQYVNVPIGKKIIGAEVSIVDNNLQLVPDGVIGEIVVYGKPVANGYTHQSKATSFVNTHVGTIYRTGDLGRVSKDGLIECLGRIDEQIKIRGYRVEPGEISHCLLMHEDIMSCQVVIVETPENGIQLLAYFIPQNKPQSESELDKSEYIRSLIQNLRQSLSQQLPAYMLPSAFIAVDEWPLRPNGKVDKKLLPLPSDDFFEKTYVEPGTKFEKLVVNIWSELLAYKESKISINASFFELGGHSLLIVRMVAAIEKSTGIRLSVAEVMQRHTAIEIAELIEHYHANKLLREAIEEQPSEEVERIKI